MSFEMSDASQIINVYNFRADTREFIGTGQAYVPAYTGVPANSTTVEPPEIPIGCVAIYDKSAGEWALFEDHRGQVVYDILKGQESFIVEIGELPANVITTAPDVDFPKWSGHEWVKDIEAEKTAKLAIAESTKASLMSKAASVIEPLQDSVELNMATDDEKEKLTSWKVYRVLLNRVDISDSEDIIWPETPVL